jgi:hypothetical protein
MSFVILGILIIVLGLLFSRFTLSEELSKKDLIIGWGIKLSVTTLYVLIFTYYFSDGIIYGDSRNFLNDGRELAEFGIKEPFAYLKLMLGIGADNQDFLIEHLPNTQIWSYGDNGDFINDNRLIIRINSVIHFFSNGNVWVHGVVFAAISFLGSILLFKTFKEFTKNKKVLYYGLLIFPTISFWGGGITKETILIFGLGLFFLNLKYLLKHKLRLMSLIGLIAGVGILLFNKPHVGIVALGLSAIVVLLYRTTFTNKKGIIISGVLLLGFFAFTFTPSRLNIVERLTYQQRALQNLGNGGVFFINDSSFCAFDYEKLDHFDYNSTDQLISVKEQSKGRYKLFGEEEFHEFEILPSEEKFDVYHVISPSTSLIECTPIDYSGFQLFLNTPSALMNVFLRPFPTDPGDQLKFISFIENLFFILLIGFVIFKRRVLNSEEKSWVFYLFILGLISALLIGWSTPILGAIVRYKIAAYLPLFIAATILLKPLKNESK